MLVTNVQKPYDLACIGKMRTRKKRPSSIRMEVPAFVR